MRFSLACLLPLAVASIVPRDDQLVLNTLKVLEASFSRDNLIADADSYDGSLLNTLLFQQQVDIATVRAESSLRFPPLCTPIVGHF